MKQIFKRKKFTVEVVHFKEGNGHFTMKEGNKRIATESWAKNRAYYKTNGIPSIMGIVEGLLEDVKF